MNKPLRIALVMQGGRSWIGGSEYIKNIILALGSLPDNIRAKYEVCLIYNEYLDPELHKCIEPYLHKIYNQQVELKPITFQNRIRWRIIRNLYGWKDPRSESFLRKEKFDFIYPYLSLETSNSSYRSASWIADFQHKYLPNFFTPEELAVRENLFSQIAHHSSTIVLSSQTAEKDFHKFFPEAAHKTKVLSFKTTPSSSWYQGEPQNIQKNYCLPDRFFIISNQFWQHKNHLTVFKALKLLHKQSIYPVIVCTGHIYDYRQPNYCDEILQSIHKMGITKQVYLLGLIPKFEQCQLMRRSLAVIQPSLFEGWSTVVEDAKCFGKHIILTDLPVNLEQNPPNSIFFEGKSPEILADILADYWEKLTPGPDLQQEQIAHTNSISEAQEFAYRFLDIAASI
ncbi:glycosyltransferase [Calothrix membranacea FACHB-236]|nr:glycosyltransferase [Calothrix membranacea FACHB-236]